MNVELNLPDEVALHAGIAARVRAVRTRNVEALLSSYSGDVVTFDLIAPVENAGIGALRKRVTEWFASFETSIDYEIHDVRLAVAGDVAFDHHLTHVRGGSKSGTGIDMWFRETVGYRKIGGAWLVTHQHSSVPMDMATGKAVLQLHP